VLLLAPEAEPRARLDPRPVAGADLDGASVLPESTTSTSSANPTLARHGPICAPALSAMMATVRGSLSSAGFATAGLLICCGSPTF